MSRFDRLLPSDNKKYHYSSWEAQICKNMFSPHLVCADFYNKTPKNVELFGTFLHLCGTELVTFVKIGTCNGTSYNFVPLERNLTSYI